MLARSQVTVIRGSAARVARLSGMPTSGRLAMTRAGSAGASSARSSAWPSVEVQAWNPPLAPKVTVTASPVRSTWYSLGPSRSRTIRTTSGRNWE